MTRSLQPIARRLSACVVLSAVLSAAVVTSGFADPTHRIVGYGGILPLPVAHSSTVTAMSPMRGDHVLAQKREAHAERGRVLYAAGRPPVAAPDTSATHRTLCPAQRVAEVRAQVTAAPNS